MRFAFHQATKRLPIFLVVLVAGCSENPDPESESAANSTTPSVAAPEKPVSFLDKEPLDPDLVKALEATTETEEEEAVRNKFEVAAATRLRGQEVTMAQQIAALPESDAREFALTELMRQWASYDLDEALRYGWENYSEDRQLRRAFLKGTMGELARVDPHKVLDVIEEGNWWTDLWKHQREALHQIEQSDFERASQFFLETGPGRQHKEEAYRYAHRIGFEQDHEAALDFADGLEAPLAKAWATRAAVNRWAEQDSLAASEFVNQSADPEIRNHAILGLIDGIWQTNPQDTMVWAGEISDSEVRGRAYDLLARRWHHQEQTENVQLLLGSLGGDERVAVEAVLTGLNGE